DRVRDASSASRERPAHAEAALVNATRRQRVWWQTAHASPPGPLSKLFLRAGARRTSVGVTLGCRRCATVAGKRAAAIDRRHLRRGGLDAGLIRPAMPGDGARQ